LQFFDFRCWWLSSSSPEWVGITFAAYSSILHQIFCHKLLVASWRISEEKYPQKNQGTAGLEPAIGGHITLRVLSILVSNTYRQADFIFTT
jgi:hypothetical protein